MLLHQLPQLLAATEAAAREATAQVQVMLDMVLNNNLPEVTEANNRLADTELETALLLAVTELDVNKLEVTVEPALPQLEVTAQVSNRPADTELPRSHLTEPDKEPLLEVTAQAKVPQPVVTEANSKLADTELETVPLLAVTEPNNNRADTELEAVPPPVVTEQETVQATARTILQSSQ